MSVQNHDRHSAVEGDAEARCEIARLQTALAASEANVAHLRLELQHRVSNFLSVLRSVSTRSIERASSLDDLLLHQSGRISALARVEDMLARANGRGVDLEDILRDELATVVSAGEEDRLTIGGPPVALAMKAAERIGLAFHELTTNALKFGALSNPEGRISVQWRLTQDAGPQLEISWIESGVAVMNSEPKWTGFGRDLLERALPYDLDADTQLRFAPGGLHCRLSVPLNARTVIKVEGPGAAEPFR